MTDGNDAAYAKSGWHQNQDVYVDAQVGLTKREYFAAMAMQGFAAKEQSQSQTGPGAAAMYAVKYADALIRALNEDDTNSADTPATR